MDKISKISGSILLSFFITLGHAQSVQRFQYVRLSNESGSYWQLINGRNIVTLSRYNQITGGRERTITRAEGNVTISFLRKDNLVSLKNEHKEVLATFPYRGGQAKGISLADGTKYKLKNKGSTWMYISNEDKEVLVCSFKREGNKRFLEYEIKDPLARGLDLLMLASHDIGIGTITSRQNLPIVMGVAILSVIVRLATYEAPTATIP